MSEALPPLGVNPPQLGVVLPDLAGAVLSAEGGLQRFAADPVAHFRCCSYGQRDFLRALSTHEEVALQTSNFYGKTTVAAHGYTGMMRGVREMNGDIVGVNGLVEAGPPIILPAVSNPASFVCLAQGREMAKESVIKAMKKAVGRVPHHWEKNGNAIAALWVKPDRSKSDRWDEWSVMRFFVEQGQSTAGMRLDGVWADEPPWWPMWMELRMRPQLNKVFVRAITFTPIDKPRWKPVIDDFRGCARPGGKDGKLLIRGSIYDNKMLSKEHIKRMERAAKGPLAKAKLLGEEVDLTGSNPFDAEGLKKWGERCVDPARLEKWVTSSGNAVEVQVWGEALEGEQYMVVADPSAGIEDEAGDHDPCEVVVVSRGVKGRPAVVARYNGYIPAYELGRLSTHLAKRYRDALLVWERNSGYGEAFFLGVGSYGNVYIEHHLDARGLPLSQRVGWTTTATTRGTIIGALQKAILEDGLIVLSADAVESLKNVVVKRDGIRIEAGAGAHDEDMIVLGLACHLLETYPMYSAPQEKSDGEKWLERRGFVLPRDSDSEALDPFAPL